jgi:hypothetical protein
MDPHPHTVVVPGLLWPAGLRHVGDRLSALPRLLARSNAQSLPPANEEIVLLEVFGLDPLRTSRATIRALGDGLAEADLICADPVHLSLSPEGLVLSDAGELAIELEEAKALVASLNQQFEDLGRFILAAPDRWYLRLHEPGRSGAAPLIEVIGRRIDHRLPSEPNMRRLLNEIQMLLHPHPVNVLREQRGLLPINSIWLWGEGEAPHVIAPSPRLEANGALAKGLSTLSLPGENAGLITVEDTLLRSAYRQDFEGWIDALVAMDHTLFTPILRTLGTRAPVPTLMLPGDRFSLRLCFSGLTFWQRLFKSSGDTLDPALFFSRFEHA